MSGVVSVRARRTDPGPRGPSAPVGWNELSSQTPDLVTLFAGMSCWIARRKLAFRSETYGSPRFAVEVPEPSKFTRPLMLAQVGLSPGPTGATLPARPATRATVA